MPWPGRPEFDPRPRPVRPAWDLAGRPHTGREAGYGGHARLPAGPRPGVRVRGTGQGRRDMSGDPGTTGEADDAQQVPDPIRVLIVDDHALFRRGLEMVLATEPDIDVVGEAGDGAEALTMALET